MLGAFVLKQAQFFSSLTISQKFFNLKFKYLFISAKSRINSVDSFVSAVEEPDDLMKFGEGMLSPSHFVIASPSLVHRYSQHLGQLECLNWNSPLMIPLEQRQFSIAKNLMVCCLKKILLCECSPFKACAGYFYVLDDAFVL